MGLYPGDRLKYAAEAVTILHCHSTASIAEGARDASRNDHEGEA
jgi:hypothetical protein